MDKIFKEGHQSYYDFVPRYKNPYDDGHTNDISRKISLWNLGWDSANKEHEFFTENQSLKAKNKELVKKNEGLVSDFSKKEDDIDTILNVLLKHLKKGFFVFPRENIKTGIFQIKDIISKI